MFFVSKKVTTTPPYKHFSSKEMAMRSRTDISFVCPATPHGECASLEHTVATALAVLLSLIHSQNWLQLPVCLVRACKLKQEEKGRSKCFSCAEEGWGLFFMVAPLWFNLQIWSTSDLSVAHGSWQWNVVLLSGWVLDPWLGSFGPCAQWGGVSCGFGADTWEWRCWIYSTCCSAARGPEGLLWGGGDFPLQLQV